MTNKIEDQEIHCLKCQSKNVNVGNKGYSLTKGVTGGLLIGPLGLIAGLHGHKKIKLICLNCGAKWNLEKHIAHVKGVQEEQRRALLTPEERKSEDKLAIWILISIVSLGVVAVYFLK